MSKEPCIGCGTTDGYFTRGLCGNCYNAAYYKVRTGQVTWERLEELELAKPKAERRQPWSEWSKKAERVISES